MDFYYYFLNNKRIINGRDQPGQVKAKYLVFLTFIKTIPSKGLSKKMGVLLPIRL